MAMTKSKTEKSQSAFPSQKKNWETPFFTLSTAPENAFFGSNTNQPKLKTNQPDDKNEKEAERIANQAMQMSTDTQSSLPVNRSSGPNGSGKALDQPVRGWMQSFFGSDLSHVRIHTDRQAENSAEEMHANAYTIGLDITFGVGQYSPKTKAGLGLLAHELTHVLQNSSSGSAVNGHATHVQFDREYESSTDRLARQYVNAALSHRELVGRLTAQYWSSPANRRRFLRSYFTQLYLAWDEKPPEPKKLDALVEKYDLIVQEHEVRRERKRQPVTAFDLAEKETAKESAIPQVEIIKRWMELEAKRKADREKLQAAIKIGTRTGNYSGVDIREFTARRNPHKTTDDYSVYNRFLYIGQDPTISQFRTEISSSKLSAYGSESGNIEEPNRKLYVDPGKVFIVMRRVFSRRKGEQQTVFVMEQWVIAKTDKGKEHVHLLSRSLEGIRAAELTGEGFGKEGALEPWAFPSVVPVDMYLPLKTSDKK